ncbi:TonB-dependent receptor [Roseateles cellulosilyticus]|uniref:TonB-dependent receptor n=1 Tax=Pelomonas cellulosilytica TaxID=2906762 RepID=A0ABS8XQV2_9BURK|nr:TonB-dependent receptor [Pelomonas sp. P8]MCE4553533.1 TonB-dependent receptor [Pelomonas sp. P8]
MSSPRLARRLLFAASGLILTLPAARAEDAADDAGRPAARLGTVVISGDKLKRSELESTQSVGTRSGRQIDEQANVTLQDVASRLANVGTTQGLTIRGIPLYGPGGGSGKTATVTVDGVAQEAAGASIADLSVWDVEAVEVLRGPQSTNQGRNALAGAVVMKTRGPTDDWDLRGRVSMGNQDTRRVAVAGGGALVKDLAAFRIAAEAHRDAGGLFNETRQDKRWNHDDGGTFRGKLRLTPFGDSYQALLTYADVRLDTGRPYAEATLRKPQERISLANEGGHQKTRARSLALEQNWSWAGAEWTWLSTWARNHYDRAYDYDETELNQGTSATLIDDRHQSHELRANFETRVGGNKLKGVAGLFMSRGSQDDDYLYTVPVSYVLGVFGQCPSVAACEAAYKADFVRRRNLNKERVSNRAVFGEFDYTIDRLTLTAGVRYDHEAQDRDIGSETDGTTPTAARIVQLLRANSVIAPDGTQVLNTRYSAWLPKLAARYELTRDWQAGLAVQRGYRTGGVNYSYQRGANAYEPEYTTNYDLSLKGQPLPGLLLAVNAYRVDWRDQQVNVGANSLDVYYVNAGRSRLHGLEFELRGQAAPGLELFGALGVSRTRFQDFSVPSGNYSGKQFPGSPRQTASLGFSWKRGDWTLNSDVVYEGGTYSEAVNDASTRSPGHVVLNAKLAYQLAPRVRAFAYGANLFDQTYAVYRWNTTSTRQVLTLGAGRTVGLGLEAQL